MVDMADEVDEAEKFGTSEITHQKLGFFRSFFWEENATNNIEHLEFN